MIKQVNIHEFATLINPIGNIQIMLTGLQITWWMIMCKNNTGSATQKSMLKDNSDINDGTGDSARWKIGNPNDSIGSI